MILKFTLFVFNKVIIFIITLFNIKNKFMAIDPTKDVLYIKGNEVRYKQRGFDGSIKRFNVKPVQAVFQGIDIIVTLEDGHIRRIKGPGYNVDESIK